MAADRSSLRTVDEIVEEEEIVEKDPEEEKVEEEGDEDKKEEKRNDEIRDGDWICPNCQVL